MTACIGRLTRAVSLCEFNLKTDRLWRVVADKICDQISDAVLDAHLHQDSNAKVACGESTLNDIVQLYHWLHGCQLFFSEKCQT